MARKVTIDGHRFDSSQEASRYLFLKACQGAGELAELTLQPNFELQPSFKIGKRTIRKMEYTADFRYTKGGLVVIEEFKGFKREGYLMRKKLFLYRFRAEYDIFQEVTWTKKGGYKISEYKQD